MDSVRVGFKERCRITFCVRVGLILLLVRFRVKIRTKFRFRLSASIMCGVRCRVRSTIMVRG
jgi:hypothetical protein